ncbi:MAG: hypothetical protein H0U71_02805 [Gammaproteobacteria bacterium]|nr:hypothetical protein [Gammaproteobacteria bacterium]
MSAPEKRHSTSKSATTITQKLQRPSNINLYAKENWSHTLSDHLAQTTPILPQAHIINWNIMAWGNGHNNAYQKKETREEYFARLIRIAKALIEEIKGNPHLAIATLQEVPENQKARQFFFQLIKDALLPDKNWVIDESYYQKSEGNNFGLFILYDKVKLANQPAIILIPGLTTQEGRTLTIDLQFLRGDKHYPVRIINAHFRYKDKNNTNQRLTVAQAQTEIDTLLNSTAEQVVIAADYNQDIHKIESKYPDKTFYGAVPSSVTYKEGRLVDKNIDGFIFKYPPELD